MKILFWSHGEYSLSVGVEKLYNFAAYHCSLKHYRA